MSAATPTWHCPTLPVSIAPLTLAAAIWAHLTGAYPRPVPSTGLALQMPSQQYLNPSSTVNTTYQWSASQRLPYPWLFSVARQLVWVLKTKFSTLTSSCRSFPLHPSYRTATSYYRTSVPKSPFLILVLTLHFLFWLLAIPTLTASTPHTAPVSPIWTLESLRNALTKLGAN